MEPATLIVSALALGGQAGMTDTTKQAVKEAYQAVKQLIKDRFQTVGLDLIEQDPSSNSRRALVDMKFNRLRWRPRQSLASSCVPSLAW